MNEMLTTKNEHFYLGVSVKLDKGIAGGRLHYIPRHLVDQYESIDELQKDVNALRQIKGTDIEGNTIEELHERMKEIEEQLLFQTQNKKV